MKKVYFGNLFINIFSKNQLLQTIKKIVSSKTQKPHTFIYINSGSFYYREQNKVFAKMLQTASYIRVSGFFLRFFLSIMYKIQIAKVKTEDFIEELFAYLQKKKLKVFLLGSDPQTLYKALENTKRKYADLSIKGYNGYFNEKQNDTIIQKINRSNTDVLIVGLGSERQETWVYNNKKKLHKVRAIFTVGNFIDIMGEKDRIPPLFLRRIGMEWLYRIILEPNRLGKRYILGSWLIIKYLLKLL